MTMLLIVFRSSLDDDVRQLLGELGIKAFTEATNLAGTGQAGTVFDSFNWPGSNSMIFAAMDDNQAERVAEALKRFRDQLLQKQHGAKVPLHVFSLPCRQIL